MQDLFSGSEPPEPQRERRDKRAPKRAAPAPLAERMRPATLQEFRGQEHLVGPGGALHDMLESGTLSSSLLFWGPPGSGKTTLARLLAQQLRVDFVSFSAVTAGIQDVREVVARARQLQHAGKGPVLLFVDEVHRFNKAQQDAFLPHIENGMLILVGATTENPSFAINSALRSRSRVFELHPLAAADIEAILEAAIADPERGLGRLELRLEPGVLQRLAVLADGDARTALSALEFATAGARPGRPFDLTSERLRAALARRQLGLDRGGEEHYNLISALHKSLRGSDPDASLYWLARILESGEDPLYLARRLMRFASEDVGNADPHALGISVAAAQVVERIGMPEADLALAQAVLYLATAPKSNRVTLAYGAARQDVREHANPPVPLHLRNAPTPLMRDLGRGVGYLYPHDYDAAIVVQEYLPEPLRGRIYYTPSPEGHERELAQRLQAWREIRDELQRSGLPGRPRARAEDQPAPGAASESELPRASEPPAG